MAFLLEVMLVLLYSSVACGGSSASTCRPPDLAALKGFASSLSHTSTTNAFLDWRGDDCCLWTGVSCTRTPASNNTTSLNIVSQLSLRNSNLTGAIPHALCGLSALSTLDLSNNDFFSLSKNVLSGSIPSCLGDNLTNLQELRLAYNALSGVIPSSFSRLLRLRTLDLRGNYAYNYLDEGLFGSIVPLLALPRLAHLNLSENRFNGSIAVFNTPSLQILNLSYNSFSGPVPPFTNTPSLQRLSLSSNLFSGPVPPFTNTPSLQSLDLSYNSFSGPVPPFANTPSLQILDLSENLFISGPISPFTNTPSLQILLLSGNSFSAIFPSSPAPSPPSPTPQAYKSSISNLSFSVNVHLQSLQILDLSFNTELSGYLPVPFLSQLHQLRHLNLDGTLMSAGGANISQLFCKLQALQTLSISFTALSGVLPSPQCERPSVNLTSLDLSDNQLTGPFPAWIGLSFPSLQSLDLFGNNFYGSIPQQWQNLTQLNSLSLSANSPVTPLYLPTQIQSWLFRLPLQTLTLRSMGLASQDLQCAGLSLLNTTIQWLDLSDNHLTSAHAMQCLAHSNFTNLESLDLSSNPLAFDLSLVSGVLPSLRSLNLTFCHLHGQLSNKLSGMFSAIQHLYLAHNYFVGHIPSQQIGSLASLSDLDLSHNHLTGPIPPSMANLSYIFYVQLNNNHLDGEIPQGLGNISSLQTLFLGNNQLTKASFSNTQFIDLEILDLSYNRLEGDLQNVFGDYSMMRGLIVLLLGYNHLTGSIPVSLNGSSAPFLAVIQLSNNNLTGAIPRTLALLPALRFPELALNYSQGYPAYERDFTLVVKNLHLSYHYFSPDVLAYLDLSCNMLNGFIPEALSEMSMLRDLNLSTNQLSGPIPSSLAHLSLLESLDLSFNKLQGHIPMSFSQLTSMEVFNVSFNEELIGQIPGGPQFEDSNSYIGDPNLCGDPVLKNCSIHSMDTGPPVSHEEVENGESFLLRWIDEWVSIPGMCLGYVLGFGGMVWALKLLGFV